MKQFKGAMMSNFNMKEIRELRYFDDWLLDTIETIDFDCIDGGRLKTIIHDTLKYECMMHWYSDDIIEFFSDFDIKGIIDFYKKAEIDDTAGGEKSRIVADDLMLGLETFFTELAEEVAQ